MRKLFFISLTMLAAGALCLAAAPKFKNPAWKGKGNDRVLLFHGGRPWQADGTTASMAENGLKVRTISGQNLNGLSGASFEHFVSDKPKLKPIDGITPTFAKLSPKMYKLVVFHIIPEKNMSKIFTPENLQKLYEYVDQGGNVLFTINTPIEAEDLLPVTLGSYEEFDDFYTDRPTTGNFEDYPEKIPVLGRFRNNTLKEGAQALCWIKTPDGDQVTPYIARINIGKGTVTYFNGENVNPRQFKAFSNWAYSNAFFQQVINDCIGKKIGVVKKLARFPETPARPEIAEVNLDIADPVLNITDNPGNVTVVDNVARFADGTVVSVSPEGAAEVTLPGQTFAFIKNAKTPEIRISKKQRVFDDDTAEATNVKESSEAIKLDWKLDAFYTEGNLLAIKYVAGNSEMVRYFKAGKMNLNGRIYTGIAEKTVITKSDLLISGIHHKSELNLPDPLFARRFDCYQPPRGYKDFDMTGKETSKVIAGQPFKHIVCKNGVFLANGMDIGNGGSFGREKGAENIYFNVYANVGRIKAPAQSAWYWRWFSEGPERGHNEYLAMYQFQRKILRNLYNLKELPGYPVVRYDYQLKQDEKLAVIAAAAKAGYRFVSPPNPESPIESINTDGNKVIYKWHTDAGVAARIWTAGSYTQGNGTWTYLNHPEWFVRDENGKIMQYFKKYPVIDINNQEFYKWCTAIYKDAIDHGVKWFYRDMDGAASSTINYAMDESPLAAIAQAKVYKYFHDNGARVGVEGMNPLVLDEYWFRAKLYTPMTGIEFAMVGQVPNGDIIGGLGLDPIRTGMYACFPMYEFSGTAFSFDRIIGEAERGKRVASFVPTFNKALDFVGMPFVQETDFGTVWYGKGGAVMFFWNPVKKLTLNLPDGWKIRGVEGNVLNDVKGDSIIFIDRK